MSILDQEQPNDPGYVSATFKGTRIINGHSIETRAKGELDFLISHRFGPVNTGVENFWGLDGAQIRLGLTYGLLDNLNVGVGRSSFGQTYDFFAKWRFLRQSSSVPVSAAVFSSFATRTDDFFELIVGDSYQTNDRHASTAQLLVARKMGNRLSLQVTPTVIATNYVLNSDESGLIYSVGLGGRYKLTNRLSLNMEYFPSTASGDNFDAFAIGVDIETGGHVFQLHFTNAQQIIEKGFIAETDSDFLDGGVHFGFNISRVFNLTPGR